MAEFDQTIQPQSGLVKKIAFALDEWRALTCVSEKTLVPNFASTVPWIAPLIPAWFAFENTTAKTKLDLPNPIGVIISASIEGLGVSVITTALELWDWNDTHKENKITAPIYVSAATVVFYLVVVISINVGLDLGWPEWIVKVMLSTLSVPAIVTLALRSQHARRISAQEAVDVKAKQDALATQEAQRRQDELTLEAQHRQSEFEFEQKRLDAETRRLLKLERARAKTSKTSESSSGTSESSSGTQKPTFKTGRKPTHRDRVFQWMDEYYRTNGSIASFSEVEQALSLPQSTASRLRGEWLKERPGD